MKKLILSMFLLSGIALAEVYDELSKLEAEQRVLQLKIENYKLQKQVAEYEALLSKKRKLVLKQQERESALIELKEQLRQNRTRSDIDLYPSSS
jgi:paraquat-inducible protein B